MRVWMGWARAGQGGAPQLGPTLGKTDCSYAVATAGTPGAEGMMPAPNLGPLLTLRALARQPPAPDRFALSMGDLTLF